MTRPPRNQFWSAWRALGDRMEALIPNMALTSSLACAGDAIRAGNDANAKDHLAWITAQLADVAPIYSILWDQRHAAANAARAWDEAHPCPKASGGIVADYAWSPDSLEVPF